MRITLVVAAHHLRRLLRRPALVFFLAMVPLSLIFIESAAFGPSPATASGAMPGTPVVMVDDDHTALSRAIQSCVTDGIGKDPLAVTSASDDSEAMRIFRGGANAGLRIIPAGLAANLARGANVTYYPGGSDGAGPKIAANVLAACVSLANQSLNQASSSRASAGNFSALIPAPTAVAVDRPPQPSIPANASQNFV